MEKDLVSRLKQAFARLDARFDNEEDELLSHTRTGRPILGSEVAQAKAMLDVLTTRLGAVAAGQKEDLDQDLAALRLRWDTANQAYEDGDEQLSQSALREVQDGVLQLVTKMNQRFAGHPAQPTSP